MLSLSDALGPFNHLIVIVVLVITSLEFDYMNICKQSIQKNRFGASPLEQELHRAVKAGRQDCPPWGAGGQMARGVSHTRARCRL